jgi:two-component system chemotaxis response regulator CheY
MGGLILARILIVDDSAIMRRNLSAILIDKGHEIVGEATNGMHAFNEYEACRPDLITMDVTMPIVDGIQAVKNIMFRFPEAKIIMISTLNQKDHVFTALKHGAKHYIIKPFTPEKVIEVVDIVLGAD